MRLRRYLCHASRGGKQRCSSEGVCGCNPYKVLAVEIVYNCGESGRHSRLFRVNERAQFHKYRHSRIPKQKGRVKRRQQETPAKSEGPSV